MPDDAGSFGSDVGLLSSGNFSGFCDLALLLGPRRSQLQQEEKNNNDNTEAYISATTAAVRAEILATRMYACIHRSLDGSIVTHPS